MKYNVLVVDDELDSTVHAKKSARREFYNKLNGTFQISFLEDPAQLQSTIETQNIHAVLLDFFLERWKIDALTILRKLPEGLPVGLISGHWQPNFEKLRLATAPPTKVACVFSWEDFESPERLSIVSMWMESVIAKSRGIAITRLGPDEPIRILHLSDIQFEAKPFKNLEADTGNLAQLIYDHWGGGPTFIAVTGDITEHALPSEYQAAKKWLQTLAKDLDNAWTDDRFLVIPGNHDVCWGLGKAARVLPTKDVLVPEDAPDDQQSIYKELKPFAFAPFRTFARDLTGGATWQAEEHSWVLSRYRHLGVVFGGLNTSEELDAKSAPTRRVPDATLAAYFNALRAAARENDAVVIGMTHHPIFVVAEDPKEEPGIANPNDFIKSLANFPGTYVNLCGHVHASLSTMVDKKTSSILEIVASTATKPSRARHEDTLRGFNLIELTRSNERVTGLKVVSCKYERTGLVADRADVYERALDSTFRVVRPTRT